MSLNNLSKRLNEAGASDRVVRAWREAIDAVTDVAARAELRAAWAWHLAGMQLLDDARGELQRAAAEADAAPASDGLSETVSAIIVTRARKAIRSQAHALDAEAPDGLPLWAVAPIADAHVDLVNAVTNSADWPAVHHALTQHLDLLRSPEFRMSLQALAGLYLGHPGLDRLLRLLEDIDESGVDAVFRRQQEIHERLALLDAWIATPTWPESRDFFHEHEAELTTTEIRRLLVDLNHDAASQHLAIIDLTRDLSIDAGYAIVTNRETAEEAAFEAMENGHLERLALIADAAPSLQDRPITWGLVAAVLLLTQARQDEADELIGQIAEHSTAVQRRAHIIRLRALLQRQPHLAGLDRLIQIIEASSSSTVT